MAQLYCRKAVGVWVLLMLGGMGRSAHASVFEEFTGARSTAMGGAHRAIGTSNETLIVNPAGLALVRRYDIDLQYGFGFTDHLSRFNVSAIDSKSGPVAGGAALTYTHGNESGVNATLTRIYVGAAYAFGRVLAIGLSAQNVRGSFRDLGVDQTDLSFYTGTAGVLLNIGDVLALGAAYQNIIQGDDVRFLPPTLGFGAALHLSALTLTSDLTLDLRPGTARQIGNMLGAEVFIADTVALRAGWRRVPVQQNDSSLGPVTSYTAGLGIVTSSGGVNITGERLLAPVTGWNLLGAFQLFF